MTLTCTSLVFDEDGLTHKVNTPYQPKLTFPRFSFDFLTDAPYPIISGANQHNSIEPIFTGTIALNVFEPLSISGISAHVFMTEKLFHPVVSGCEECSMSNIKINSSQLLASDPEDAKIEPGIHEFPLEFLVPSDLPPTYGDKHRQIEYSLSLQLEIRGFEPFQSTKTFNLSKPFPKAPTPICIRDSLPHFITEVELPSHSSLGSKFDIRIKLKPKGTYSWRSRVLWEVKAIRWKIREHTQQTRLPCLKHTEVLQGQATGTMNHQREIFFDAVDVTEELGDIDFENDHLDSEQFFLPCNVGSTSIGDISTPSGYKVWHEVIIDVLYYYKYPSPIMPATRYGESSHKYRRFTIREPIIINEGKPERSFYS